MEFYINTGRTISIFERKLLTDHADVVQCKTTNECDALHKRDTKVSLITTGFGMSGLNADGGEGGAGTVLKPEMDEKIFIELVSGLYRLNVKTIKELNSYYDRNYRIKVEEQHTNPHIHTLWPHGYTLKVLNSMDSQKSHVGMYNFMFGSVKFNIKICIDQYM